ncbi:MAG: uroporphyrinogen decarboxylase [Hyphomicrobiales bacterium]
MSSTKPLLAVLDGKRIDPPPIWLMRQAGRFLPEYRALRAKAGSFMGLAYDPAMAAEATLQPIRRFGFDAAILFSDILVVPDALNCAVSFVEGEGPRLSPIGDADGLRRLSRELDFARLAPVFEAIGLAKKQLPEGCAMLGFCGAPWTVASYMIAGRSTPDLGPARLFAYRHRQAFKELIERLVTASIAYLVRQFEAGVDAVQIFESFGGAIPKAFLSDWSLRPIRRIIEGVRAAVPGARMVVFGKGIAATAGEVATVTGANAVGIDWSIDPLDVGKWSRHTALQGNLDPLMLAAGGEAMDEAVARVLIGFRDVPHIFNLGHGVVPETPIENVERLLRIVRGVEQVADRAAAW